MNWLTASARVIARSVPGDRVLEAMEVDETPRNSSKKGSGKTTRWRKEQMTTVVWTTPLGLPIVQPYRKVKRRQIMTSVQSVYISDPNAPAEGEQTPSRHSVDEANIVLIFYSQLAKAGDGFSA